MCYGFPGPAPIPAVFAAPAREARIAALTHSDCAAPQREQHRTWLEMGELKQGPRRTSSVYKA